jgi:hypothetical protein
MRSDRVPRTAIAYKFNVRAFALLSLRQLAGVVEVEFVELPHLL